MGEVTEGGVYVADDDDTGTTCKAALQQAGQFGVAKGDEWDALLAQGVDDHR